VSGPQAYKFSNARTAQTEVRGLEEGVYRFACTAKDANGNVLSDTVQVTVQTLVQSTATVFPNPSNGRVNLRIEANTRATNTLITVYDLGGRIVHHEEFMRTEGKVIRQLDLSGLRAGVYMVVVAVDINNKISLKVVKQ
jgi:hypothetical protein